MKLTLIIIFLPFLIYFMAWSEPSLSRKFGTELLAVWLLSVFACFGCGVYISRQSRLLGWLCVAVGLVQLIIFLMPAIG